MSADTVDLPNDDPRCPRVHLSLKGKVTREQARSRLSREKRETIANALDLSKPYSADEVEHLDQIAGMFVRLDRVIKRKRPSKSKDVTVAKKQRDEMQLLLEAIRALKGHLNGANDRVRARVELELATTDGIDRRKEGAEKYDRHLRRLTTLQTACKEAKVRIQVVTGRDSGRAARSLIEQMARIWVKVRHAEPRYGRASRRGTFDKFVDVILREAHVNYFNASHVVRRVVEYRQTGTTVQHTKRDTESDN